MDFNKLEVYDMRRVHNMVPNFGGNVDEIRDTFYKSMKEYLDTLNLSEQIEFFQTTINIGGGFFGKNKIDAVGIKYKNGKMKKLGAFYLMTNIGNVLNFSLYKQASLGFFDILTGKSSSEKVQLIQSKLKTIEEDEEFSMFNAVSDQMFEIGLNSVKI